MAFRCPRAGTRVTFTGTPAAVAFYRSAPPPYNRSPEPGESGTVTAIAGFKGQMTCMPGPGGGMVYVDWDRAGVTGVLRNHTSLSKAGLKGAARRRRRSR